MNLIILFVKMVHVWLDPSIHRSCINDYIQNLKSFPSLDSKTFYWHYKMILCQFHEKIQWMHLIVNCFRNISQFAISVHRTNIPQNIGNSQYTWRIDFIYVNGNQQPCVYVLERRCNWNILASRRNETSAIQLTLITIAPGLIKTRNEVVFIYLFLKLHYE